MTGLIDQNFRPNRRHMIVGAAALAAGQVLDRTSARAQTPPQTWRVVNPFEFRTLEPTETGFAFARACVTETLVLSEPDGSIGPGIAESWQVAPDGLTWRFRIRAARFHDGTPVTAELVKASLDRLVPKSLYVRDAGITAIEASGQDLTIRLGKPFGPFLEYAVDTSAPILAPSAFDAAGNVVAMIGTGPYRITRADLPRMLELAAFADHWGPRATVPLARYEAVTNGDTRANIALAGDADLVLNVPTTAIQRVSSGSSMQVQRVTIPRTHHLMVNAALPQFASAATRRALSMAIDRVGIATAAMRNPALAATQYVPPSLAAWHSREVAPYTQDVAGANALLDREGWLRGADGVRVKDGVRFAGTVRTFAARAELPVIATALQAQFRAIGFDLAVNVGEVAAVAQGQRDGTLELGLTSRNLVIVPDPISTIAVDFTRDQSAGQGGATNWRNQQLRDDVAAYMLTADASARARLRASIVRIIHDEVPTIPIVWFEQVVAVAPRVAGYVLDPFEQRIALNRMSLRAS
jgi:peptide/nickel transport system substrate-binding protein